MNKLTLVSAKGVKGGKVQLTFSQIVETGKTVTSLTSLLNASDERFNQQKPRLSWISAEPTDVQKLFGIDVSGLTEGAELEINMVDPRIIGDDRPLNIRVTETTKGSDYDVANFETRAKRAGKDGDFILHNGMYIYVKTDVVPGEPNHVIYSETTRKEANASASSAISDALGE
jgi:hypothetical protein